MRSNVSNNQFSLLLNRVKIQTPSPRSEPDMPTEHASFTIMTQECPLGAIPFKCSCTLGSCFARHLIMVKWAFIPGFTEVFNLTQPLHNGHQHQITMSKSL